MTISLPLQSYRCSARAIGAKSAGSLALGLAALALAPHAAEAGIVVFTPSSDNTVNTSGPSAVYFSVFGGQVSSDFFGGADAYLWSAGDSFPGGDNKFSYVHDANGSGILFAGTPGLPNASNAQLFAPNASIQDANGWYFRAIFNQLDASPGAVPGWAGTTGYIGLKLPAAGGFYYGWAKVAANGDASSLTLVSFAINDVANAPIMAGQTTAVPEPATSAALLALGAAGLVAYRRRKNLQRTAA